MNEFFEEMKDKFNNSSVRIKTINYLSLKFVLFNNNNMGSYIKVDAILRG